MQAYNKFRRKMGGQMTAFVPSEMAYQIYPKKSTRTREFALNSLPNELIDGCRKAIEQGFEPEEIIERLRPMAHVMYGDKNHEL